MINNLPHVYGVHHIERRDLRYVLAFLHLLAFPFISMNFSDSNFEISGGLDDCYMCTLNK